MKQLHRTVRISLALAVILSLAVAAPASGALTFTATVLMNQPGYGFYAPQIGGRYVVATRDVFGFPGDSDIVVYDRWSGDDVSIGYGDGKDQVQPAISGTRIAWIDRTESDGEVWYDDRADGLPARRITDDTHDDVGVKIDGNHIVWVDGVAPGRHIRWYDIERDTYGTVPGTNLPNGVSVDRGRVCWYDDDKRTGYQGIYLYDLETGQEIVVTEASWATTTRIGASSPSMHGDNVAWVQYLSTSVDDKNIFVANVRAGAAGQVTYDTATQHRPAIFGDILAWQDDRSGGEDILCWWGAETGLQNVAVSANAEEHPDVHGHSVVYHRDVGEPRIGLSTAPLAALRIEGDDRYETAALVSERYFPASTNVVIATGEDFPDALSASALAGALECPLLLTRKGVVPEVVLDELERLGVDSVWLVGGDAVIADSVFDQLEDLGLTVQRVSGPDRYATAKHVAYWVMDIVNSAPVGQWRQTAFFVRGDEFPDALAVAPHAYAAKIPILLVRPDSVPTHTEEAVTFCYIEDGIIVGGTSAVSATTATEIGALLGDAAVRWDGADRYATAVRCAQEGVARGWLDYDAIGVATGANFPDALGGGAACGHYGSPIVLTSPSSVPAALDAFFTERRYEFGGMSVFGGAAAVSGAAFTQLGGYLD